MKNFIEETFYLSNPEKTSLACRMTNLSDDELEHIVGRFTKRSQWSGQLRGKIVAYMDGKVEIRTSFGNKLLWTKE